MSKPGAENEGLADGFTNGDFPLQIIQMRKAVVLAGACEVVIRFLQYAEIYVYTRIGGPLAWEMPPARKPTTKHDIKLHASVCTLLDRRAFLDRKE